MKELKLVFVAILALWLGACDKSESTANDASQAKDGHEEAKHGSHEGETHKESAGLIELSAEQTASSGIELAIAGPAKIRESLTLYGTIRPNAERVREVTARYPGIIRSVTRRAGDAVREGETLATVESNESLRTYPIVSPISGVVTERRANPGEYTGEGPLFVVTDLSSVWVELSLFPRNLAQVRIGQPVRVHNVDGGIEAQGQIVNVSPLGQTESQTLIARVLLANPDRRWAPGLYVTAEVTLSESEVPVAVLSTALQSVENRSVVFVSTPGGFKLQPVVTGRSDGEYTEVVSGLAANSSYVAVNSFVLKSELGKGEADHEH